jgi:flagellar protein FliJ
MFRFSLQPVIEHRMAIEQRRQRELAEATAKLETARSRRALIDEDLGRRFFQIREGQLKGLSFARRQLIEQWIVALREDATKLEAMIRALEEDERKRRLALIEAVKGRMILDRLREKERGEWMLQERRAELKAFDEIAVRNYAVGHGAEKDADPSERISR